jgi:hypothetical protein
MLITSLILFAIAAIGGLFLAVRHFKKRELPMSVALIHGLVAAIALVLLIIVIVLGSGSGLLNTALLLFVVAAILGFFLFGMYLRKRPLASGLLSIHAILAVAGFVLLLIGMII